MAKDVALLVLRLSGFGLAFAHGWQKVAMLSSGNGDRFVAGVEAIGFPLPIVFAWAAALSELVGGLCIAFGIATRVAASFAAFTVFVASFFRHRLPQQILVWMGASSYPEDVIDGWGNPERAATYLLIFIALVLMGGGGFSLQRLIRGGKKRR
ncbi:MAG TPA: DoxX family protein [Vicinamibacteria bacterium]|nr:DoxX family protein [Vicinamibacteria bacterium]